jgi:hypothetical protein
MPNLILRRRTDNGPAVPSVHRCTLCHHELRLVRRHVSPPRFGAAMTTELYQCVACDASYAYSPASGKWRPWINDAD